MNDILERLRELLGAGCSCYVDFEPDSGQAVQQMVPVFCPLHKVSPQALRTLIAHAEALDHEHQSCSCYTDGVKCTAPTADEALHLLKDLWAGSGAETGARR